MAANPAEVLAGLAPTLQGIFDSTGASCWTPDEVVEGQPCVVGVPWRRSETAARVLNGALVHRSGGSGTGPPKRFSRQVPESSQGERHR